MRHAATVVILIVTASSCGSASTASQDDAGAIDGAAIDGATIDVGPTSPIARFDFVDGTHSDMPFSQDENYSATRGGEVTYHYGYDPLQTATLSDADRSRFIQFLDDPATISVTTDTAPCPRRVSDASPEVTFLLENYARLSRNINGCEGPAYEAIWGWAATIRGYFP